jgi:outer membrane receptor protein involved in Fe transport
MMMARRVGCCLFTLLAAAVAASAEEGNAGGTVSPPQAIVVTATRVPRRREELPASVTVLGASVLRSAPLLNADDALRTVSGVAVVRSYGMGYGIPMQINLRGVPGIHGTLLLADGFPLNEAATGFLNIHEIPAAAVRQIEVVRGPLSAVYGPDAFGGVVQLLTPEPEGPAFFEAAGRAGNEGFRQAWALARARHDDVGLVVSADARRIANYVARDHVLDTRWDASSGRYVAVRRPASNYDYADRRVMLKIGAPVADASRLTVLGRIFDGELGYGQTQLSPLLPPVNSDTENGSALIGASLASEISERLSTRLSGAYRRQTRELWGPELAGVERGMPVVVRGYSETVANEWRAGASATVAAGGGHVLSPGIELTAVEGTFQPTRVADSGEPLPLAMGDKAEASQTGVYLQDEAAIGETLRVALGVRVDDHSGFGTACSPRGGVVCRLGATSLRASAGRAYRAPSLLERYQPDVHFGSYLFQSDPDLEPEDIVAVDAGVDHHFGDALALRLDGFHNDMDDLISRRTAGSVVTFENVAEAWSAGGEAAADWFLAPGFTLSASYTRQWSEDRDTGLDLAYVPEQLLGLGMRAQGRVHGLNCEGSLTEQYVGSRGYVDGASGRWRPLAAYWRTDACLKATWPSGLHAGIGAQNLTDQTYQEASTLNPAPGRLWYVEAGMRF